jgi:hypothetical protein
MRLPYNVRSGNARRADKIGVLYDIRRRAAVASRAMPIEERKDL